MPDTFGCLLCLILCQHNWPEPNSLSTVSILILNFNVSVCDVVLCSYGRKMSLVLSLLLTGIACICSGAVQWTSQCKLGLYAKQIFIVLTSFQCTCSILRCNDSLTHNTIACGIVGQPSFLLSNAT